MTDFVHLHVHSEYSLLDGACRIKELPAAAAALGQKAVAVTDHGNLFAAVIFYDACVKAGIKPIIGCEVYVADGSHTDRNSSSPYHLTLLCKNSEGWRNLSKLVSLSYSEGYYYKPRVDMEQLEAHSGGLVCLSGCIAGEVSSRLAVRDFSGAKAAAMKLKNIYGEDFYLEIMRHDDPEQMSVSRLIMRLSDETGIPLCATNDVHYIRREDSHAQRVLMCINTGSTLDEAKVVLTSDDYYLRSGDEMAELFRDCPQALENTVKIAEKCDFGFIFGETKLPFFALPEGTDHYEYLRKMTFTGLSERYGSNNSADAEKRADYELSVIEKMGYVDYFLIVWDFVHYAKTHDIPVGCGRGSGAGSIVAYCIGITDIDPLKYGLIFERFLNPARTTMPDFDIDFCTLKRQRVIDYVISRYGADHVSQIITFGTLGAKSALRDCARAMGLPYKTGDIAAKAVPQKSSLAEALGSSDELKKLYNGDPQIHALIETAMRIENMPRNISTHAAGVVITKEPVDEYVPLFVRDGQVSTQFTMGVLERLGLLKMDFLALGNLTTIDFCVKDIRRTEPDFSLKNIPLDDKEVFKLLSQGKTQGVFQLESAGMTAKLMQLCPDCINDLIAMLALYRPGPMSSIPNYIAGRADPSQITYAHPLLKGILEETYGCIVYQEQVMEIFRRVAGYPMGRADLLRRAISKKHTEDILKERQSFIHGDGEVCGALANGVPEQTASRLFDDIVAFGDYAFNKSHAAAYANISYQTAYLKCHYYKTYMAALLTVTQFEKPWKLTDYLNDVIHEGVKILPLDINKSTADFFAEPEGIRFSLRSVKGLGEGLIGSIVKERTENGRFTSFYDFCVRTAGFGVTVKTLEALIKCGALDGFGNNRREMLVSSDAVLSQAQQRAKSRMEGQLDFFGGMGDGGGIEVGMASMPEFESTRLLEFEREVTGMYLSGHPLDRYAAFAECVGCLTAAELSGEEHRDEDDSEPEQQTELADGTPAEILVMISSVKQISTKKGDTMCFVAAEDRTGSCEVIVFPKLYGAAAGIIKEGSILHIAGKVTVKDDEPAKLIADYAETADRFMQGCQRRRLCVRADSRDIGLMDRIREQLTAYSDGRGVIAAIWLSDRRQLINLRTAPRVRLCEELIRGLQAAAGASGVLFMKDKR
ncbi:MAG: DNA polymerase III subunit alpha [Ruminococcus sp.]|nr:DNA polymerase III subunit alpha [Ruminococcus sp.]